MGLKNIIERCWFSIKLKNLTSEKKPLPPEVAFLFKNREPKFTNGNQKIIIYHRNPNHMSPRSPVQTTSVDSSSEFSLNFSMFYSTGRK